MVVLDAFFVRLVLVEDLSDRVNQAGAVDVV